MSKERISASVDPEVAAYLQRETVNASGTINELVKNQMASGGENKELIKLRLEQINSEIERHNSQIETLEKERDGLQDRLESIEEQHTSELTQALEDLENVPRKPDNPAIQTRADELGMTPDELIDELEGYYAE